MIKTFLPRYYVGSRGDMWSNLSCKMKLTHALTIQGDLFWITYERLHRSVFRIRASNCLDMVDVIII